ncbi:MAG: L,D-transpeptidase family protein [Patescibacteria group bacterium]
MNKTIGIPLFIVALALVVWMPHSVAHAAPGDSVPLLDSDSDGLSDEAERLIYYSNPSIADTDGDGYSDGDEIKNGFSPINNKNISLKLLDADKDGLNDDWEIKLKSDLMKPDTDGDGIKDGKEVIDGFSPTSIDKKTVAKKIEVNVKNFTLKYYNGGVLLDSILVSTGAWGYPTPRGTFAVLKKKPTVNYGGTGYGYSYPGTKWNLHFTSRKYGYFIHGAYWHNNFGKKNVSHGCVNVAYKDMERLYNWSQVGTPVHVQ